MTLRTVTYDTATHKIVPLMPTNEMLERAFNEITASDEHTELGVEQRLYLTFIERAPEYQEPENPLDMPLPCDIKVGHGTIGKGCKLSTLVFRMNVLYGLAMKNNSAIAPDPRMSEPWTPEEKADLKGALSGVFNWNQEPTKDE